MIPGAEKILAAVLVGALLLTIGFTGGSRWTGAQKDKDIAELKNQQLEQQQKWNEEREAASVRAAEAAAEAAGKQAALNQRNAQLGQEVLAYASDKAREQRQCFDARGSSLWNQLAAAPAGAAGVRREPDAAAGAGSPAAAGAGSQ